MPLTMQRVLELRSAAFADDIDASDEMRHWSEEAVVAFYESGGQQRPAGQADRRRPRLGLLHGQGGNRNILMLQLSKLVAQGRRRS
jgi:hypothetical protein